MHINNLPHFNVIFIPGTVDYQSIALISLLLNSDLNFRLVGNSLNQKEAALLKQISDCSDRLDCINFESEHIIPHGTLVDLLLICEQDEFFTFCDSDLFLFSELKQSQLIEHIGKAAVFTSGGRIENQDDVVYAGFKGGATTVSPDGKIDLATSFFCVYQRQPLEQVLNEYQVGFEQYRAASQIPVKAMQVIDGMGLDFEMFDTGKLISVLLHELGYEKKYHELDGLTHIGGMSGRYLQKLDMTVGTIEISEQELPAFELSKSDQYQVRNEYEKSLKRLYGKYFYSFLNHQIGKGPKPVLNATDERIINTVNVLENSIQNIISRVGEDQACKQIWRLVQQ
jgi:hypothetical protein